MKSGNPDSWALLIDAIVQFYRVEGARGVAGASLLVEAAATLKRLPPPDIARAKAVAWPVRRFAPKCLELAEDGPLHDIAVAFAAIEPFAEWLQNPNYTPETIGAHFLDGYGYVEPVGPGRLLECANLRVGLLLLGPHRLYTDHAHPAEEVYHVVAGHAEWLREGEDWREQRVGAAIHHPPHVRHATRTRDAPLLALYCWGGEVGPAAALAAG